MSYKLLAFLAGVWLIGTWLGASYEGSWAQASGASSPISYLLNFSNAVQVTQVFGLFPLPYPNPQYFTTVFEVITWRWSFLQGGDTAMIYQLILIFPLMGVASLVVLVISVIRGNVSWGIFLFPFPMKYRMPYKDRHGIWKWPK